MIIHAPEITSIKPPELVRFVDQKSSQSELASVPQSRDHSELIAQLRNRVCVVNNTGIQLPIWYYWLKPIRNDAGVVITYFAVPAGIIYEGTQGVYTAGSRNIGGGRQAYFVVFDDGVRGV